MHERHQVEHLINHIQEYAKEKKISAVTSLTVVMGDLLGFDEQSVRLYFETLGEGTLLENATVSFRLVSGELFCKKCQQNFAKNKSSLNCLTCGEQGIPTEIGKEFFAEDIQGN